MFKKIVIILIILFLNSMNVYAVENTNIEVFDITQGKVVKGVKSDPKIQAMAIKYLNGITGIYGKFNPIPDKGYAIGIHLEPPTKIKSKSKSKSKSLNLLVNEVVIMFPQQEPPFLMVTDEENKLVCFRFKGNISKLLKYLDFEINPK